jgi:methyltransferase
MRDKTTLIFFALLLFYAVGRLYELFLTKKHFNRISEKEIPIELGVRQRAIMICMHTLWFISIGVEFFLHGKDVGIPWSFIAIAPLLVAQGLRQHSMSVLGEMWTTRIYIRPTPIWIDQGLYRWVKHPNYLAVVLEFIALPLLYSCWWTLAIFSLLNAIVLFFRIKTEEIVFESVNDRPEWVLIPYVF